jgi:plastocyanin
MRRVLRTVLPYSAALLTAVLSFGQDLRGRIAYPGKVVAMPPAVVWLTPLQPVDPVPAESNKSYTLLQKNRSFIPHLLVVPVGSHVEFPNEDPFYHNVFSLFDGKRFDLGLYEAGSTKTVTFSREGVSYIFCNIHPEMSAVVVALATPFYAIADKAGSIELHGVPAGDYELHVWAEGIPQPVLNRLPRRVHVTEGQGDLGVVTIPVTPARGGSHLNKFGQPYDHAADSPY